MALDDESAIARDCFRRQSRFIEAARGKAS